MQALNQLKAAAVASGIKFDRVTTNGINMHYARKGRGYPLILLHGWPEFCLVWKPVMDILGDHFDLIAPDLRGFGETGKSVAGPDINAGAEKHADDIAGLAKALGLTKFGLACGDVGSYVGQAFALKYGERLSGAFFFNSPYPGMGPRYGAPGHLIEVWYQYFQQLPWSAKLVGSSREACRAYIGHFLDHWSGDNPAVFKEVMEAFIDNYMMNDNIQGGFDWYVSSAKNRRLWLEEKLPHQPKISVPSRFLWGKRDPLVPIAWSDRLGEYFENYSIDFADAGHFVAFEKPDQAASEIKSFFDKLIAVPDPSPRAG